MKSVYNIPAIMDVIKFYFYETHRTRIHCKPEMGFKPTLDEYGAQCYIHEYLLNKALCKCSRREFVLLCSMVKRDIQSSGNAKDPERSIAILNKLIGDTKLFDKILLVNDGSYTDYSITIDFNNVSIFQTPTRYNLDPWFGSDHSIKEIKKKIDELYRDYDHIIVQTTIPPVKTPEEFDKTVLRSLCKYRSDFN